MRRRGGSVLVVVVVVCTIVALLAFMAMNRSVQSSRSASWSREHAVARLLAESAVDEVLWRIETALGDPSTDTFKSFRVLGGSATMPVKLSGLEAALATAAAPGASIACSATIETWESGTAGSSEGKGTLAVEATVRTGGRVTGITERVRQTRGFRVARALLPAPLERYSVLIRHALEGLMGGDSGSTPASAPASPSTSAAGSDSEEAPNQMDGALATLAKTGTRSMAEIFLSGDLTAPSSADVTKMAAPFQALFPRNVALRAHFASKDPTELVAFMQSRLSAGRPVNGVLVCFGAEPLNLQFDAFRGKCTLCAFGPIKVGDIKVADPTRDSLTLVSRGMITVFGKKVDASLISIGGAERGVTYAAQATVTGSVLAQSIAPGGDLSLIDLGWINFAAPRPPPAAGAAAPRAEQDPTLVALVAPYPSDIQHFTK